VLEDCKHSNPGISEMATELSACQKWLFSTQLFTC